MNFLIVEDEKVAAERLVGLIKKYDPSIDITEIVQSVKNAVQWLNTHQAPDLIFMDIQLADGLSFEIYEQTIVKTPVIFTTAYDEYALKAFKVNSIDYLLKPVDLNELKNAIDKYKENNSPKEIPAQVFDSIMHSLTKKYKDKFVINVGEHIKVFTTEDIQCFYSMEKYTFLQNNSGRDYAIGYSLMVSRTGLIQMCYAGWFYPVLFLMKSFNLKISLYGQCLRQNGKGEPYRLLL